MTATETVAKYYDGWRSRQGDLSDVPQAVTSFTVRRQFVDGNEVFSIIDWEMAIPGVGRMTSAELLEVEDGVIVRGELIDDAEALRQAIAAQDA